MLHEKLKDTSTGFASKAVKKLFLWADSEGRRLFLMKGAKAFVVSTRFLQLDILTNNANDICRLSNLSNNVLGDVPGQKEALHNRKGKIGTRRLIPARSRRDLEWSCTTSLIAAF